MCPSKFHVTKIEKKKLKKKLKNIDNLKIQNQNNNIKKSVRSLLKMPTSLLNLLNS